MRVGSILVPIPIKPPGIAYFRLFFSVLRLVIVDLREKDLIFPFRVLTVIPGHISILSFTHKIPDKIVPPTTPPLISLILHPGLFISNDRTMNKTRTILKFLFGNGILVKISPINTSILHFLCAETGIIVEFLILVFVINFFIKMMKLF